MDPDRIIRDFCAAWGRADLDAILEGFAEDAVYHNIPMEPMRGKPAIKGFIEGFLAGSPDGIDFDILHQVVNGRIVMNERVDTFSMAGKSMAGKQTALPVCGVFELDEAGKIRAWRDYFDMGAFQGD